MKGTEMTFDFNFHLKHHINALTETVRNNEPIMKKLYDSPSTLPLEDLIMLRERLQMMEAHITLLNNAYEVHLEDEKKKTKRRRFPFKK
jgi:hypothetical protein